MSRRRLLAVAIAIVIVVAVVAAAALIVLNKKNEPEVLSGIRIAGDSGLASSRWVTGGSGTAQDPYVIEGLGISVTTGKYEGSLSPYGLLIYNVDAHLTIRGLDVEANPGEIASEWWGFNGVVVSYSTNITISDCTFSDLIGGVVIESSTRVTLLNNTFEKCRIGVSMDQPDWVFDSQVYIGSNRFLNTSYCIIMERGTGGFWIGVSIVDNSMSNYDGAITIFQGASDMVIQRNHIHDGRNYAIRGSLISGASIMQNLIYWHEGAGIVLEEGGNIDISDNDIRTRETAISLYSCSNIVVERNNVTGSNDVVHYESGYGVVVQNSKSVNITYNKIWGTTVGVMLLSTGSGNSSVWVHHNEFIHNWVQATDNSISENHWDDGIGEGNFWSDATGFDTNFDNILDTPYKINSDNLDHYPLTVYPF